MRPRIVILGGGFAGLSVARRLFPLVDQHKASVTLINREHHHLYTPSLYEILGGVHPRQVCIAIPDSLDGHDIQFLEDSVDSIELREQTIRCKKTGRIPYDHLVLALGSVSNFFGIKGVAEYAYSFKTIQDAWLLRQHIEDAFRDAHTQAKTTQQRKLHFIIAGGGPTGVETAGELAELRRRLAKQYHVPLSYSEIEIVEAGETILPAASRTVRSQAIRRLRELGVTMTTNNPIKEDRVRSIVLGKGTRATETLIWTAGVKPHPLVSELAGLRHDRRGAVLVDQHLQALGRPGVWVVGDIASTPDAGIVLASLRHAETVADNIARSTHSQPLRPYEPQTPPLFMPIGHDFAIVVVGRWLLSGKMADWLRRWRDLYYLLTILPVMRAWSVWMARHAPCPDCHTRLKTLLVASET